MGQYKFSAITENIKQEEKKTAVAAASSSDDEDFDKDAIHHLRLLFEDHPSLNDYIQLND